MIYINEWIECNMSDLAWNLYDFLTIRTLVKHVFERSELVFYSEKSFRNQQVKALANIAYNSLIINTLPRIHRW